MTHWDSELVIDGFLHYHGCVNYCLVGIKLTVKLWLAQFVFELNIEVPVKNAVQSCK